VPPNSAIARAIRCAQEIEHELQRIGVSARAGLHIGEVQRNAHDVHGLAVHIAARIGALADQAKCSSRARSRNS
jgi:class 3 adenylate cyclase